MIMDLSQLPFKDGEQAESKSFTIGYRSAWFRCKIIKSATSKRSGQAKLLLEFFDYPAEKRSWTKLYENPTHLHVASNEECKMELMLRPSFPPIYRESEPPDSYPVADVIAIVSEPWKVGDLVDWWFDGCYWSARVIQIFGNDKVQVELPDPPKGEGKSYEALCKDLRPSLDWSPGNGWTVPISKVNGENWYKARLIQPHIKDHESEATYARAGRRTETTRNHMDIDSKSGSSKEDRGDCSYESSKSHGEVRDGSGIDDAKISCGKDRYGYVDSIKGKRISGSNYRNSRRRSDTIDSSIIELEELANKIRWIKGLLQVGLKWSNAMKPSWRFLENYGAYGNRDELS